MSKFKVGDRVKVIKALMRPSLLGLVTNIERIEINSFFGVQYWTPNDLWGTEDQFKKIGDDFELGSWDELADIWQPNKDRELTCN